MNMKIGVVCGVAAVALLLIPTGSDPQPPTPNDEIKASVEANEAFDTYKRLWLKHNLEGAEKLDDGELTTAEETWEFLASGQEAARKVAFKDIADKEQELIGDEWTAEKHSKILKGYAK